MAPRTDTLDLARLRLASGEGRRLVLEVRPAPLTYGGERYGVAPAAPAVTLDVSRTAGSGYALRLRFEARLEGPCMRCLQAAAPSVAVDAREVFQPRGGEELASPYVDDEQLDLAAWARDALALALPATILCREDCLGLCPECGVRLEAAGPEHRHERAPDPRWDALRSLGTQP
jgi:uncharacterized protein